MVVQTCPLEANLPAYKFGADALKGWTGNFMLYVQTSGVVEISPLINWPLLGHYVGFEISAYFASVT